MQAQQTPATSIVAPTATLGDLAAIMADLSREHPEAGARVKHGAFLAIMGHAESDTATGWWVQSERDDTQYFVLPQYGTCTCPDHQRHGHLSPCKHRLAVEVLHRLERRETDREQLADAVIIDVDGQPIPFTLTEAALAALDDQRQRDAARCPTCWEYKQHGSLYCEGDRCVLDPQRTATVA